MLLFLIILKKKNFKIGDGDSEIGFLLLCVYYSVWELVFCMFSKYEFICVIVLWITFLSFLWIGN